MKNYLFIALLSTLMLSCNIHKNCNTDSPEKVVFQDREVIREVVIHDTTFLVPEDNSQLKVKLMVDTVGNVVSVIPISKKVGKNLNAPSTSLKDNVLTIDCETRAQELFAQWKSENTTSKSNKVVTKTIEVEADIPGLKIFLMWVGGLVIVIGILTGIGIIIYKYKQK